jgi:hypothetical protein
MALLEHEHIVFVGNAAFGVARIELNEMEIETLVELRYMTDVRRDVAAKFEIAS